MRSVVVLGALGLLGAGLAGCSPAQLQSGLQLAQSVGSLACAGATAGAAIIAADGTILKATPGQLNAVATGQNLVAVNCAALPAAFQSVAAAAPSGSVAVVNEINLQARKLHVSPALLRKAAQKIGVPIILGK